VTEVPWFRRWFGEEYLSLYPHRDEEEAVRAVDLLLECVPLSSSSHVLDLACGAGRHLRALTERGVHSVGLDLSLPLLLRYREDAATKPVVRGDMRSLPFAGGAFDAVTSFFTSFGYFHDDRDDRRVLEEIRRVLRPGGHILLDFLHADRVRESLSFRDEEQVGGRWVIQERRLLQGGQIVEKTIRIEDETPAQPQVYTERVRLYSPEELEALLIEHGLEPEDRFGDYGGSPFDAASERVILLARVPSTGGEGRPT